MVSIKYWDGESEVQPGDHFGLVWDSHVEADAEYIGQDSQGWLVVSLSFPENIAENFDLPSYDGIRSFQNAYKIDKLRY